MEPNSEACSYPDEGDELELGLGLSLGGAVRSSKACGKWSECGRILTAKDFPSIVSHNRRGSDAIAVSGTKRAADSVSHEGASPPAGSQVVGWPPIRAYRMNSLVNQAKAQRSEDEKETEENDQSKDALKKKIFNADKTDSGVKDKGHLGFVKVNMDGITIGRKVDLNSHASYDTLAKTIEDMFFKRGKSTKSTGGENETLTKSSRLLDGSSDFVLTYEDKEGDWMLVGDVPWRMFLSTVRRLRIMRTSDANGLAPRFQETNGRVKGKPI